MGYAVEITPLEQQAVFDIRTATPIIDDCLFRLDVGGPFEKDRIAGTNGLQILKLGPRRALIKSTLNNETQIEEKLNSALADARQTSVVNLSDMYLGIRIAGTDAAEVLAHAIPIDLHELPPGSGTATAIFSLSAIVFHESDPSYSVYVDRSYFDYVWHRINLCGLKSVSSGAGIPLG